MDPTKTSQLGTVPYTFVTEYPTRQLRRLAARKLAKAQAAAARPRTPYKARVASVKIGSPQHAAAERAGVTVFTSAQTVLGHEFEVGDCLAFGRKARRALASIVKGSEK